MFTIALCLVAELGLGLRLLLDLVSGWLSCYAHVFVRLKVVILLSRTVCYRAVFESALAEN